MSRPIPNVTLGGFRPNQVKINSIGIGIDDESLDSLNLNSSQFMVVGGQTNDVYNLIVDSEGVVINSSIINRAATSSYSNEYALYVDGNIFVTGKVDTSSGTLSNIAGGGGGGGAFACNYWMPVRRDIPSSTNIFYDGRINVANEGFSRSNTYRVNIVDNANYTINNAQFAIQNQVGSVARTAILGYSNLSPVIFNSSKAPIEFHAGRTQSYFDSVYRTSNNLPIYTSNTNAPHLVINADGNVGIKVSPNPPITYSLRTTNGQSPAEVIPTVITNKPVDLHVEGTTYSCNMLMFDYESKGIKNLDDLYVRKLGVTFAASQVEPGSFAAGNYSFLSNVSIGGPIEEAFSLSVYGKVHIVDQLYADKAFLTSNLVVQDTLQVLGTTSFENDVIANENVQVNQNLVVWGGIYADSNSIQTIIPGGSNQNTTTTVSFVGYVADGWSNIYPQGAGFITPGKAGIGINSQYDTVPAQLSVISRDSNIYGLSLVDKTNNNFTKAFFVGHQRSNIIDGLEDASVIFATPSSTSPYFNFTPNPAPQNMYFYPGKYDKTILGSNTAADNAPPTFSLYETGQAAINSFIPNANLQLYVNGSIGFSSNLYVDDNTGNPTKLALFKYGPVVGITNDIGVSYNDTSAPYVAINRVPDNRYGLAVNGGIQADTYYTPDNRKGVLWKDSTTANSDTTATTTNGLYAISKVGIGINEPTYLLDIQGDNNTIGNEYGTYIRMIKSTLDESLSNTGIRFDGITRPWFVNVESISTAITRYHVGCSPDIYSLVDTESSTAVITWSSNVSNTYARTSNTTSISSYLNTSITTSNLSINSSNIVNNSNIYNLYNITYLSNVSSNITMNINNIPNIPAITYNIGYDVLTTAYTGLFTTLATTSNYTTPLTPTRSNIINSSNVINTSNITNTSNIYYYINTSNYNYSSNTTGITIQHDNTKGIYGHQVVIGGNGSLVNNSYNNPNPNPNAILTVNGDTSIMGSLNVSGYITANNTVPITTSARSNVPSIEADDLFISGKDVFINPTNKMYVNYTEDMKSSAIESGNKAVLNVYQDIVDYAAPAPIAHFVAESDNAYIEIVSKAINSLNGVNDGILRIGVLPISQSNQVIGFQDGKGIPYMTFRKLGSTSRAMGINTNTATAQLHIVNNSVSLNENMLKLTYDTGGAVDTPNYTPNITFEKQFAVNGNTNRKQWLIEGPTYGTDLNDQLSFKYVKIVTANAVNTITSNTVLSITSNGCIGINNTTPTYLLDIVTSNIANGVNHGIRMWNKMNLDTAQLVFQSGDSPDIGGDTSADYVMYSCNSEFVFSQRKTGGTTNPLLYYNSNANLGINTVPSQYFDVNIGGILNVTKSIFLNGTELFSTSNTSGSTIQGTSNIYLLPAVTVEGGIVVNGNFPTGNLFHMFNDNTGSDNMMVYDSILDKTSVYYRNRVSANEYNVYQMYSENASFGLAYQNMADRSYTMPTSGLENVFYFDGVQSTNYMEHDLSLFGNLSLTSSVRGKPTISFGSNGTITGNNQNGSLYIMPGYSSNVGIGTTLPRSMMDVYGTLLVSGNVGIGTTLPKGKLDVNGNMSITGNIVPSQCNVFDIGSSNYRFRDIYLSGNTIDLDGTLLQRDSTTGGLKIISGTGSLLDTSVKDLYVSSNVGIGTTIIRKQLDIIGDTIVSGNIGIGTSLPRHTLDIDGFAIFSEGIGIGTTLPLTTLHVVGQTYHSTNVGIGTNFPRQLLDIQGGNAIISGTVGIGTTLFNGFALNVVGTANISSTITAPIFAGNLSGIANSAVVASNALGLSGTPDITVGTVTGTLAGIANAALFASNSAYASNATYSSNLLGTPNITVGNVTGTLRGIANAALFASNAAYASNATYSSNLLGTPNITVGTVTGTLAGIANAAIFASNAAYASNATYSSNLLGTPNIIVGTVTGTLAGIANAALFASNAAYASNATYSSNLLGTPNIIVGTVTGTLAGIANAALFASNATYSSNLLGTPNISVGTITTNNNTINAGSSTMTAATFIGNLAGVANSATIASNALGLSGTPNISVGNISASAATISGTLLTSNLIVLGSNTIVNTYTISTSNVSISNITGTGPALSVSQKGAGPGYPVADFYDIEVSTTIPVLRIADGGNIGIGTTTPSKKLDVTGDINFTGSLFQNGISYISDSQWITSGTNIYYNSGNIGIGTSLPRQKLDVRNGNAIISGNVGIGITNPSYKLQVQGDSLFNGYLRSGDVYILQRNVYTAGPTTLTLPTCGFAYCRMQIWGGGGGGGGGCMQGTITPTAGNSLSGGAGGGSGAYGELYMPYYCFLGATVTFVVGAGGAAGANINNINTQITGTSNFITNTAGSAGGASTVTFTNAASGSYTYTVNGGGGGTKGAVGAAAAAGTAGTVNTAAVTDVYTTYIGFAGGGGVNGAAGGSGVAGAKPSMSPTGGGGGGGAVATTGGSSTTGGNSGTSTAPLGLASISAVLSASGGIASGGAAGYDYTSTMTGGTGGGGGSGGVYNYVNPTGNGGAYDGGSGGFPGGGGGGGGSVKVIQDTVANGGTIVAASSANGGAGGDGAIIVSFY